MVDRPKNHAQNACSNRLTIYILHTHFIANTLKRKIISMLGCSTHWYPIKALERVQLIVWRRST